MMAGLGFSGALLLVLLVGASYSNPLKGSSSHSSNYGANLGSASTGSNWGLASSSGFEPAAPGSGAASNTAPHEGYGYYQPEAAAASFSSMSFAGPGPSGSASSAPADTDWVVKPRPFSGVAMSGRPEASTFVSRQPAPAPLGPGYGMPPPPLPEFQAGEFSQKENTYEHGNFVTETEEQGSLPPPPGIHPSPLGGPGFRQPPSPLGPGFLWYPYDYRFLTGQYPPGLFSHFSSSFEQGTDHWQDAQYIKHHSPAISSPQQVKTFPSDPKAPQSINQPGWKHKVGY